MVAASGCIPARDNPNEPRFRPSAALAVYVETPTGLEPAVAGTRTTRFTLDAEESRIPSGLGSPTFEWDLDGDGEFDDENSGAEAKLSDQRLPLSASDLPPGGVGSVVRQVSVRVSLQGDLSTAATASAYLILSNAAPLVDPGEEIAVPARTGGTVILDACGGDSQSCTTRDPDGDPLVHTWEAVSSAAKTLPLTSLDEDGRRVSFTAPLEPQILVFRLTSGDEDGLAEASVIHDVRVGRQVWAASDALLYRIYAEFEFSPLAQNGSSYSTASADPITGDVWMTRVDQRTDVWRFPADVPIDRNAQPPEEWNLSNTNENDPPPVFSLVPRGDVACAARGASNDVPSPAFLWLGEGGSNDVTAFIPPGPETPKWVFPDPAGSGECLALSDTSLYRLSGSALTPLAAPAFSEPTLAAQDVDGSLWIVQAAGSLLHLSAEGSELATVALGTTAEPRALAPRADGGVWLYDFDRNRFLRVDESGFSETGPLLLLGTESSVSLVASLTDERLLFALDDFTETIVRLVDRGGELVLDGQISVTTLLTDFQEPLDALRWTALEPDPKNGRILALARGTLVDTPPPPAKYRYVTIPSHLGRARTVAALAAPPSRVIAEPTNGTVWVDDGDNHVRNLTDRGREVGRVTVGGSITALAPRPGGGLWIAWMDSSAHLVPFGPDGIPDPSWRDVPLAAPLEGVSDEASGIVCAATSTTPLRIDVSAGSANVQSIPYTFERAAGVAVTPGGGCWFLETQGPCPAAPGTPEALWSSAGGPVVASQVTGTTCPHSANTDPRTGALWLLDNTAAKRVTTSGTVTNFALYLKSHALSLEHVCDEADSDCVKVWIAADSNIEFQPGWVFSDISDSAMSLQPFDQFSMPIAPHYIDVVP